MRLKLDENIGKRGAELFREAGHEVVTVLEQQLCSASDKELIDLCAKENRCLVTLDVEFGNPFLFRPADYFGIAVLRLGRESSPEDLDYCIRTLISALAGERIERKLWIVQKGRIREYQPDDSR